MSVIGVDLDGTLAQYTAWTRGEDIGEPDRNCVWLLSTLARDGHKLYIWTTRPDYLVGKWLYKHNLIHLFEGVNTSPYPTETGKASFDFYIGDEALHWDGNPTAIYNHITDKRKDDSIDFVRETGFSSHNPRLYYAGVGRRYVDMHEAHWQEVWEKHKFNNSIAFLTICSHAKPYSKSFIHSMIRKYLWEQGFLSTTDYIHISNAGIIPSTAEMEYPFNAYDWDGTLCSDEVKQYHIEAIKRRFKLWVSLYAKNYQQIIIYLRGGGNTFGAIQSVLNEAWPPRIHLIPAKDSLEFRLPYVLVSDIDDCLTNHHNLNRINLVIGRPIA
jgi:hypothetical protein